MTSTAKAKVPDLGLFKTEVGITCSHSYLKSWLLKNNLRAKVPQDIPGKVYFISARNTLRSEDRSEFTVVDKDEVIILQYNKTKTCASLKMTVGATVAIPIVPKDVSGCEIFYGIMFYSLDDAWEVASKFEQVSTHYYSLIGLIFTIII